MKITVTNLTGADMTLGAMRVVMLEAICHIHGQRLGLFEFANDPDCQCYRATCPQGRRFEPGLHELIAVYGDGVIGNGQSKREALADLIDRLADYEALETCDDLNCDHCVHSDWS